MKKKELITAVAAKRQLKQKDAAALVDDVLNVIAEALQSGDSVTIPGFGTLRYGACGTQRVQPEDAEKNRSSCYQSAGFPCGQAIKAQRKSLSIRSVYPTKRSVGRSIYGLHQKAIVKAV